MSPSWITHPELQDKQTNVTIQGTKAALFHRTKRFWIILTSTLILLLIGLGVGLGVGLTRSSSSPDNDTDSDSDSDSPSNTTTNATTGTFWRPTAGETWQIVLQYALNDTSPNVSVYDIDLFDNPRETITALHDQGRKAICYFSAGSYESYRPDSNDFKPSDKGKELDGWPGEYWLDTNSDNVRAIMTARLDVAVAKGCDGVDPDNVDAFDNENGLGLTTSDSISFLTFLATEAHSRGLAIGLKNGASVVEDTLEMMQWQVNEQCVQAKECASFQPFIEAGKPVFHIEYPDSAPDVSVQTREGICGDSGARGFSTILKEMSLNDFYEAC